MRPTRALWLITALFCLAYSNENSAPSRRIARAFPGATRQNCTIDELSLNDILAILHGVTQNGNFSADEDNAIESKYKTYISSKDRCKNMLGNMLKLIREIVAAKKLFKDDQNLEKRYRDLVLSFDAMKRTYDQNQRAQNDRHSTQVAELERQVFSVSSRVQEIQKEAQERTLRLIKKHIDDGEVSEASDEFLKLENREELVDELIAKAYDGKKSQLNNVVRFAAHLRYFRLLQIAFDSLYKKMEIHGHLRENEVFYLYYQLSETISNGNFPLQDKNLKNDLRTLKIKFGEKKDILLDSLANEVRRDYKSQRIEQVCKLLTGFFECFISELVKKLMSSPNIGFKTIIKLHVHVQFYTDMCTFLEELRKELKTRQRDDSLEDLVVWLSARYYLFDSSHGDQTSNQHLQKCKLIFEHPPRSKQQFRDRYISGVATGRFDEIISWHRNYSPFVKYFIPDVIQSLSKEQMQMSNANRWVDLIGKLPFIDDTCVASKAFLHKLGNFSMLNGHLHFQIANSVNRSMGFENYKNVAYYEQAMCESVKKSVPRVFEKLISGNTDNCKLINRNYGEPLYCTSEFREDSQGRKIYTWVIKEEDDLDQHWKIWIRPNDSRVSFLNLYHSRSLSYVEGEEVRGSCKPWNERDYFRVEAEDNDYLVIKYGEENEKRLAATSEECANERRCVKMKNWHRTDKDTHWLLRCN